MATKTKIGLLKMDAQGSKCRNVEGMGHEVAGIIDVMKFDYAHPWLKRMDVLI